MSKLHLAAGIVLGSFLPACNTTPEGHAHGTPAGTPVTLSNFARAESDLYMGRTVERGGLGRLLPMREFTPIEHQEIVRMNRDTLYASGVFDLDAAPVAITLPDAGERFMSMQVISQDHYVVDVRYAAGRQEYTRASVGTRYAFVIVRVFADPSDPADMTTAHALQDAIRVEQEKVGRWEVPAWDQASQDRLRSALDVLGSQMGEPRGESFGTRTQVDPLMHLIGTAMGWGANPRKDAIYVSVTPERNDGRTPHVLTVKDVPVDGFWSISVYDAQGYFAKNAQGRYSLNDRTAKRAADGSVTIRFGGDPAAENQLPILPGWNYTVRLYRPRAAILDGSWKFPAAQPAE